jgi:hypothetical protein
VRIGGRHRVSDLWCAIGRLVVDDDQLVVGDVAGLDKILTRTLAEPQGALDVVLLVPHRIEDRQLLELLTVGRRRHRRARVAPTWTTTAPVAPVVSLPVGFFP